MSDGPTSAGHASPYSTAGGGVVLEHVYGGALLAAMLLEEPITGLGEEFTPTRVRFQQSVYSPVDDLVVDGEGPGGSRSLFVGVRRKPSVGPSSKPFVKLMADYVRDVHENQAELASGARRLGLAVAAPHTPTAEIAKLASIARRQCDAASFRAAVNAPKATTGKVRARLRNFDAVAEVAAAQAGVVLPDQDARDELSWRLLSALHVIDLRLEDDDAVGRTGLVARLMRLVSSAAAAADLRRHLDELAAGCAVSAAVVDEGVVRRDLSGRIAVAASPALHRSWAALERLEQSLLARTGRDLTRASGTSAGPVRRLVIDRQAARDALVEAITVAGRQSGVVLVHGEPDVGKSSLTLDAAGAIRAAGGMVVALSLHDLPPGSAVMLEQILHAPARRVFSATAAAPVRVVVLDGAEVVQAGGEALLGDLAVAAHQAGLGVVVVTRDDALSEVKRTLTTALARSAKGDAGPPHLVEVAVPPLTDDEARTVQGTFAELDRVGEDPRSAWLLRRLGLIDVLLRADAVAALPDGALSEADVFAAVWSAWVRRSERTPPGGPTPDEREQAMLALAQVELAGANPAARGSPRALPSLRSDGLLLPAGPQFAWRTRDVFANDVVGDFAMARLLLMEDFRPLQVAGAPRRALRAARIACQATLMNALHVHGGQDAALDGIRRGLQRQFDALAAHYGDRWSDVVWEAALTTGAADAALAAGAANLLGSGTGALSRVLRLISQRFDMLGAADAVIAAPVVSFLLDHADDLSDADRNITKQADEVIVSWLRGLSRREREGHPTPDDPVASWRPLRARVRDHLLARSAHRLDETQMECLALLGPETDAATEALLRRIAADQPGHLAPCLERFDAAATLAAVNAALLAELTQAYYIEEPDHDPWGTALLDDGIRRHRLGRHVGHPFAAWHFGPFWDLLCAAPLTGISVINRLLNHAATQRVAPARGSGRQGTAQPTSGEETALPAGVTLSIPGVGRRHYVGDEQVWSWYRGSTTGPYPCMSALLAVERFADQLLTLTRIPLAELVPRLLHEAHSLAMVGLVVGPLVRHIEQVTDELDGFLAEPELWELEFGRAGLEGMFHAQRRDAEDVPGRDRRRWTFTDVAAFLVLRARADGDDARLDALRRVGTTLVDTATRLLASAEAAAPDPDEPPGTGSSADPLLVVRQWASMLDGDNYQLRRTSDGAVWECHPPADIEAALAAVQVDLARTGEAYRLGNTYHLKWVPPYGDQPPPPPPPTVLAADLATARELADHPPQGRSSRPSDVPTAVAACAVRAATRDLRLVRKAQLRWAAATVLDAARHPVVGPMDHEDSLYSWGADRAAATAVPHLLLPAYTDSPTPAAKPFLGRRGLASVGTALRRLTTSPFEEVRKLVAVSLNPVWAIPCGPGDPGSRTCRHVVAWTAVVAGTRAIGSHPASDPSGTRRLKGPLEVALRRARTTDLWFPRLTGPLIAACDAACSASCVAGSARTLRDALLDAYARTAVLWGERDYHSRDEDRYRIAAALLATAADDPHPLLTLIRALIAQAHALADLLRAVVVAATYEPALRVPLSRTWPALMDLVLDAAEDQPHVFADRHWGDDVLAGIIPGPTPALTDDDPTATMAAAHNGWPTPDSLIDRIERWLPHAAGTRYPADNLIDLLETVPLHQQARLGLPWLRVILLPNGRAITRGSWRAVPWLASLRNGHALDTSTRPLYDELVDALAADNYSGAVELQRRDE